MSASSSCQRCGAALPKRVLGGLCPRCVGRRVLADYQGAPRPEAAGGAPDDDCIGLKIGRYELVRKIGEGGCGVVYAADQNEPVRRRVALKLIKLGMDTRAVVARFDAERQALAMMDHPGIAKVFDAGAAADGRPYFVMELVAGTRITEYCDTNRLTLRDRLELFAEVCLAIQHAHQKGIIHRDLKPSNILVTVREGVAAPKVIDFGIAKAIGEPLTEATLVTEADQVLGTPAYMSPEQAETGGRDVDTRTDIYSLGMLLYELVAGTTAHDPELMSSGGLRQAIREIDPPRPSTRYGSLPEKLVETVASCRRTDPKALRSELRGDLDWIVMKCLEKERNRRYTTASELAQDLRRHLDFQPVSAASPGAGYIIRKFVRRHTLAVAGGALAAFLLIGTAGVALVQAARASRAEALATKRLSDYQNAQGESEAISEFLIEILQSPNPGRNGRTITVAEALSGAARRIENELGSYPERQAKLRTILGDTYFSLGLVPEAIDLREKVYRHWLKALGPHHTNTLEALDNVASARFQSKREDPRVVQLFEQVLAGCNQIYGPKHPKTLAVMGRRAWAVLAVDIKKGLGLQEQVLALSREINGPEHPETIEAMNRLGYNCLVANQYPRAQKLLDDAVELLRKHFGNDHPKTIYARIMQAMCLYRRGQPEQAIVVLEELVSVSEMVNGPHHQHTLFARASLGEAFTRAKRIDDALLTFEQVVAISRRVNPRGYDRTITSLRKLVALNKEIGRLEEAAKLEQEIAAEQAAPLAEENENVNDEARLFNAQFAR